MGLGGVAVVIPARNEAARIAATVHRGRQFVDVARALAARALPGGVLNATRRLRHVPVPARVNALG